MAERYTPCPVCKGATSHAAACSVPVLGAAMTEPLPTAENGLPPDGTEVAVATSGMPGVFPGQRAVVRHQSPSGHSNLTRGMVWLECEVIWSHGTADGFWAGRGEYVFRPTSTTCCADHGDCHLPGELICCDRCPDIERCACGHGWHLHDREAIPELCVVCGDSERCLFPPVKP